MKFKNEFEGHRRRKDPHSSHRHTPYLGLDPRNLGQQLRARITEEPVSVGPDLRRHAAQATAPRAHIINPLPLLPRTLRTR